MESRRRPAQAALQATRLTTVAPSPFDFPGTVYSHGWAVLEPNRWIPERRALLRTERLGPDRVVHLSITGRGASDGQRVRVDVAHTGVLQAAERSAVRATVRRMLRLDEDMRGFHSRCRAAGGGWRAATRGLGRLLRSPTVFEDVVKTICTTNVQWGGTRAMARGLVERLGEPGPLSSPTGEFARAFPTPEAIAGADGEALGAARLGYREPYIRELAERIAAGDLDLEGLRDERYGTDEIRRALLDIRGVGPYAAATMLMLLGRYDHLAVDSVYRTFVSRRYFDGRAPSDAEAREVYAEWGPWKYLGYWFDVWQGLEEDV